MVGCPPIGRRSKRRASHDAAGEKCWVNEQRREMQAFVCISMSFCAARSRIDKLYRIYSTEMRIWISRILYSVQQCAPNGLTALVCYSLAES